MRKRVIVDEVTKRAHPFVCTHSITQQSFYFQWARRKLSPFSNIILCQNLIFRFLQCQSYSASKYPPIDFTVLRGILLDRKYLHSPANGIRYAAICCFTKEPHRGDKYFTLFAILAFQRKKQVILNP